MEACAAVEKEVDKILNKFGDADVNAGSTLEDILQYINGIQEELLEGQFTGSSSYKYCERGPKYGH